MKPLRALDSGQWLRASAYLDRILDLPAAEWSACLDEIRREDPVSAPNVEAMLDEHRRLSAEGFLEEASPIPGYLTRPGNYLGLCGLSMPSGFPNGLPVSIQILGKPYMERDVLKVGKAFQDATDFHRRTPDLKELGL